MVRFVDINALEQAARGASHEGPWLLDAERFPENFGVIASGRQDNIVAEVGEMDEGDARFVVEADPETVLALVARLRAAEDENARLERIICAVNALADQYKLANIDGWTTRVVTQFRLQAVLTLDVPQDATDAEVNVAMARHIHDEVCTVPHSGVPFCRSEADALAPLFTKEGTS